MKTTTLPHGSDIRARFPGAREAYSWEGGCAYTAESDGIACVIKDEGTMAEFLSPEDHDLLDGLVRVIEFQDETARNNYVRRQRLRMRPRPIEERLHAIYAQHAHHIRPCIGEAFLSPCDDRLRVMAIGINAYVDDADWEKEKAGWFAAWFREQRHRFDKGVLREGTTLAVGLISPDFMFAGRRFDGQASMYVTNAIKVYMRTQDGKRATQVTQRFADHHDQWVDEMDALVDAYAAPHVIAVFGLPFWAEACASFQVGGALNDHVKNYQPVTGDARHFANRITLRNGHELLLVRMRHPAARTEKGSAAWLLQRPDFRELAAR